MTDKERIEAIMSDQHLNNVAFCNKVGLNQATLSNILAGRTNPSLQVLRSIVDAFPNLNSDWIFLGKGEMLKSDVTEDEDSVFPSSSKTGDLFSTSHDSSSEFPFGQIANPGGKAQNLVADTKQSIDSHTAVPAINVNDIVSGVVSQLQKPTRKIIEVRIFFDDGTFETFSSR